MSREETETIIRINRADSLDGFFSVYTTDRNHRNKLEKRTGTACKTTRIAYQDGIEIGWDMELPIAYLSKANFGIKTQKSVETKRPAPKHGFKKKEETK